MLEPWHLRVEGLGYGGSGLREGFSGFIGRRLHKKKGFGIWRTTEFIPVCSDLWLPAPQEYVKSWPFVQFLGGLGLLFYLSLGCRYLVRGSLLQDGGGGPPNLLLQRSKRPTLHFGFFEKHLLSSRQHSRRV